MLKRCAKSPWWKVSMVERTHKTHMSKYAIIGESCVKDCEALHNCPMCVLQSLRLNGIHTSGDAMMCS